MLKNTAKEWGAGGAIYAGSSEMEIVNNIIAYNKNGTKFGGVYCDENSTGKVVNNLAYDNSGEHYKNCAAGSGSLWQDPRFMNASGRDYRPASNAPTIDKGATYLSDLSAWDYAGNDRVADGDVDGTSGVDVGAYERGGTAGKPRLIAPEHEARVEAQSAKLSWEGSHRATSYDIQVSTSSSFGSLAANKTNHSQSDVHVHNLRANTTYYWRVRAIASGERGAWSFAYSFVTGEDMNDDIILTFEDYDDQDTFNNFSGDWERFADDGDLLKFSKSFDTRQCRPGRGACLKLDYNVRSGYGGLWNSLWGKITAENQILNFNDLYGSLRNSRHNSTKVENVKITEFSFWARGTGSGSFNHVVEVEFKDVSGKVAKKKVFHTELRQPGGNTRIQYPR